MTSQLTGRLALFVFAITFCSFASSLFAEQPLRLPARVQVQAESGSRPWRAETRELEWSPKETAIVICDMWDKHWCRGATRRVADMAPRMNQVVRAARDRGVLIIHCPSGCMEHYQDRPERKLAQAAPAAATKRPLERWCHLDKIREGELPIDDRDGGCDCQPQCKTHKAWSKQIDTIEIKPGDAITDSAEAYYLMKQRGIKNVVVMGVHTNMCVLGRPFSIRQMVYQGQNVVLMRDMTDTMYNPRSAPFVSHFSGTDLVVDHIERHWCPTIDSTALLGGKEFVFAEDKRPHLAIIIGEEEYQTRKTLPAFADKFLRKDFRVSIVSANPKDRNDLSGIEVLNDADVALLSIRRRVPPKAQLDVVRKYVADGKPLVAIRTTSHAFALRSGKPPAGHDAWPTFDAEVLGCHYNNHHSNQGEGASKTRVWVDKSAEQHPILRGVPTDEFAVASTLYRSQPLAKSATLLMTGRVGDIKPQEPVAWTNKTKAGGRVFYASLGHVEEFKMPAFERLLVNGIYWAAGLNVPEKLTAAPARNSAKTIDYGAAWHELSVPGTWDEHTGGELENYDGYAWYRCVIKLPEKWTKSDLSLFIGKVDNAYEAYVNGVKVGGAGSLPPKYQSGADQAKRFWIKPDVWQAGKPNVLAIRVFDDDGRGGFKGAAPALFNERMAIDLTGKWQFRTGDDKSWAAGPLDAEPDGATVFAKIEKAADIEPRVTTVRKESGGLAPAESAKSFDVHKDFTLEQLLSEPLIAQPLFMDFDERGRMWLVQYRQYPHPAGLKMLSRDNYWRAVYDKVPPPPPNHFVGKDRISIHEDTDGDGRFDKHKTFVEGLNITTSVARGRGGVWVLNPPYLLFYADRNDDDVPDGDPEVHLSGFGIEDSHSVTNNLRWGPDGWLYATQGSTVSGAIKRPGIDKKPIVNTMGQLVWRYHPETRRYEIFAEGGGNAFGLEIDAKGRIFSGHNGGNTRGFHYVQGGYLQKGFSKHGPLSNPYAFGYFKPMASHNVPRFTHTFLIYAGDALPEAYRGKLFGVEPLQSQIVLADVDRDRSSFKTNDVTRPVTSRDKWFRPVNIKTGPDGAIYIADWYDGQVNHYRNHEGRVDPDSGRIYRLAAKRHKPAGPLNLAKRSSAELTELLGHENKWYRQVALRLLGDRKDASIIPKLNEKLANTTGQMALESLWALNLSGGLTEEAALKNLGHPDPFVRLWTVRLLCDEREVTSPVAERLAVMSAAETHVEVRSQLAASAKRLPAPIGLAIVRGLLTHEEDLEDIHVPLLCWWAIESKCASDPAAVVGLFADKALWDEAMVKQHVLERVMRRYAMAGTRRDLLTCAKLLDQAPTKQHAKLLMAGFEAAFKGRSLATLPQPLVAAIAKTGGASIALRIRQGDTAAIDEALSTIADEKAEKLRRVEYAQIFGEVKQPRCVPVLLGVLKSAKDDALRSASLTSLQAYDEVEIGTEVLNLRAELPPAVRSVAESLLASRPAWSRQLLSAVDSGKITSSEIPVPVVRKLQLHKDAQVAALIRKHWGELKGASLAEMQQRIAQMAELVRGGHGSPYRGKELYKKHCGKCHTLFGEGGKIGPDLTTFKRDDLDNMMLNVVNPSAQIREGFENFVVLTDDGRQLNGFLADQDDRVIVLRTQEGQSHVLPRDEIDEMKAIGISIMPEGLLKPLDPEQVRDLFAYLRSTQPLNN